MFEADIMFIQSSACLYWQNCNGYICCRQWYISDRECIVRAVMVTLEHKETDWKYTGTVLRVVVKIILLWLNQYQECNAETKHNVIVP